MFRALTIIAAVVALAVTAGPATAGTSKKPPPRTAQVIVLIGANDYGLVATFGAGKDRGWVKAPPKPAQSGASGFTKVIDHDGRFTGFKDGTSNTLAVPNWDRLLEMDMEI